LRSEVRFTIAALYLIEKLSISYVEFHRVDTSHGIIRTGSFDFDLRPGKSSMHFFHAGKRMVVE
jgi:hypothetical protein